jgi:hypothetical protein
MSCGGRTVRMSTASSFSRHPHRIPPPSLERQSSTFSNSAGESSWHARCRLESRECQGNEIVAFC